MADRGDGWKRIGPERDYGGDTDDRRLASPAKGSPPEASKVSRDTEPSSKDNSSTSPTLKFSPKSAVMTGNAFKPGIKLNIGVQKPKEAPTRALKRPTVADAFNNDSSDEEEMPPEAKMRMRNIGRETPTAAGPNSFGKGNMGFCDRQKIIQKDLQKKMDAMTSAKKS